jgi:hypothetical protein
MPSAIAEGAPITIADDAINQRTVFRLSMTSPLVKEI